MQDAVDLDATERANVCYWQMWREMSLASPGAAELMVVAPLNTPRANPQEMTCCASNE
jgi:hypothetical protein